MSNIPEYTKHAAGATQESAGNVTGSERLQAKGQIHKAEANNETSDKGPSKTTGQYHASKGAIKETLGSVLRSDALENSGAQERQYGNREIDNANTQNVAGGATENVKGTVKENAGYGLGNPQMEAEGKGERAQGKAQYNANQ